MYENPFITRIDIKVLLLLASSYGYQDRLNHVTLSGLNIINLERCIECLCQYALHCKDGQNLETLYSRHISKPNRVHTMKTYCLKRGLF